MKTPEKHSTNDNDLVAYGDMFKVYNGSIEEFARKVIYGKIVIKNENDINDFNYDTDKFDYCILDIYPQEDPDYFIKIAKK
jgi:hypothetical protein